MSSNLPPVPPPPPSFPPPPPRGPGNEVLDSGGGWPVPQGRPSGGGRRKGLLIGGAVVGLGAVGAGAVVAWSAFFATGPQPAQALPAGTVAYVSLDIDPSGSQKLEALQTLRKFPALEEEIGFDTDDDLREKFFDTAQEEGACPDLDYADDIESWLGDRFAVAGVDLGGDEEGGAGLTWVGVLQVTDAAAAEDGLTKLRECGQQESGSDIGGWSIEGDWVVVAETTEIAEQVTEAAAEDSLADDDTFQKWTGEAGDPGILTAYAAPAVGDLVGEELSGSGLFGEMAVPAPSGSDTELEPLPAPEGEQLTAFLDDFEGAALTVRFEDEALEVETASSLDYLGVDALTGSDQGGEVVSTLPEDTAAAFGLGFEEGWFDEALETFVRYSGGELDVDEMIAEAEGESGLALPEDAETLAGESLAVALDGDFDPDAFVSGDLENIGLGVKVKGDPEAIGGVVDKILESEDLSSEEADAFGYASEGDYVAFSPDADYREELLADGDLGGSDTYEDVVPDSDRAASVLYVNFDAGDGWLTELAGGDGELADNLEPLAGLGVTGWRDDDVSHGVFRLTTN